MKKYLSLLLLAILILPGCKTRMLDFTLISSKNVDLSKAATFQRGKARVSGKDAAYIIIIIPTGVAHMKEALDKAIEATPGAVALVDGVVYSYSYDFILFGEMGFIIEGTPLIDPKLGMNSDKIPDYSMVQLDRKGQVKEYKEVSKQEYLALRSKITKAEKKQAFKNSSELK
jgi:hypothetical protein